MTDIRKGDIWWAQLPEPVGRRPVLVLTRSAATVHLTNVSIVPLSRTVRGIPTEAVISPADGVPELSAVNLDNILTVPKSMLIRHITRISDETLRDVHRALRVALDLPVT